jgi:hypothetical protein
MRIRQPEMRSILPEARRARLVTSWTSRKLCWPGGDTIPVSSLVRRPASGGSCPPECPSGANAHWFSVRILYLTWVELSGLEPLTSCMPCRPISSARVAGRPVLARQATCGVWLGPALAARVWVRSHLACNWLSGSHQGGETP